MIENKQKKFILNKGLTLIELIIYISFFSIILLIMNLSFINIYRIIQNNNRNFYIKNQIYFNLNILQQYLYNTYVNIDDLDINNNKISLFDINDNLIFSQEIKQNQNNCMYFIYKDKSFCFDDYIKFNSLNIKKDYRNNLLIIKISWVDDRGKVNNIEEYLIVINRKM